MRRRRARSLAIPRCGVVLAWGRDETPKLPLMQAPNPSRSQCSPRHVFWECGYCIRGFGLQLEGLNFLRNIYQLQSECGGSEESLLSAP